MEKWLKISLLLCVFGFLKEFRPSEHYVYEYLIGKWRNVTAEEVVQKVYPVGTWSYLAQLFIIFLITDLCRYKPLIVALGLSGIVVWSMLIWTTSLEALQGMEVLYGTFMACEVAYYTYIYAKVPSEAFQKVSGQTRAAVLTGRFFSGALAQILITCNLMNYKDLNYITLGAVALATVWAIFLPRVEKSIYFNQSQPSNIFRSKFSLAFKLLKEHTVQSYSNLHVLKWSIWFALTSCGFYQVQSYIQPLWEVIQRNEKDPDSYNGIVEAILTLIGALGALVAGSLRVDWKLIGELSLAFCSILEGSAMLIASQTTNILVCYASYIVYGALFQFMITVASSEIAKHILEDSYGLVFGMNTLLALVLQSILTALAVTEHVGFALEPRNQYVVYGCYHLVVGAAFIVIGCIGWCRTSNKT